jgi:hypothetical protein
MNSLLVSKEKYNIKEARCIAKQFSMSTKCITVLVDIELFYIFGKIPDDITIYDIVHTIDNKIFFLS